MPRPVSAPIAINRDEGYPEDEAAASLLFNSLDRLLARGSLDGPDSHTRDSTPTSQLLERIGSPIVEIGYLLITGSKGKGSAAAIAAKLLSNLGYRVGLMTSPSLVNFRERIRINGRAIPARDFIALVKYIMPIVEEIDNQLPEGRYFSPTGMILALAQLYFAANDVQIGIIEAGRGGRFDDTNLVPNAVSVITPIMYEHTQQLGNKLAEIAWNKAGIIKPGNIVISARQEPEALQAIQQEAGLQDAQLHVLGRDFDASFVHNDEPQESASYQTIQLCTPRQDYGQIRIPLLGRYQVDNTAVAVTAVEALLQQIEEPLAPGKASVQTVSNGLQQVIWPGRCQILSQSPLTLLDGAINSESARLFCESVAHLAHPPIVALVAVPETKDYTGVYRETGRLASSLVITRFPSPYLTFPDDEQALHRARRHYQESRAVPDFASAYQAARAMTGSQGTLLIVGTLSLVKATLRLQQFDLEEI